MSSPTSVFGFPQPIPFITRHSCRRLSESYFRYTYSQANINRLDLEQHIAELLGVEIWRFEVTDLRNWLEDELGPYRYSLDDVWITSNMWRKYYNEMEGYESSS